MLSDNLNLKTRIKINDIDYTIELFSIVKGKITEIKLDNDLFSIDNGQDHDVSVEKHEQNQQISEQIDKKPEQIIKISKKWIAEEDQILIEKYQKYTVNQIVKKNFLPGRTKNSISNRAYQLHLRKYIVNKKYKKIKSKKISINFNNKILANYKIAVYEQCFNHLVFKLEDYESFGNQDSFKIINDWYKDVLGRDLSKRSKSTQGDYINSYLKYGVDSSIFEKISFGKYRIKKPDGKKVVEKVVDESFVKNNEKPNIIIVSSNDQPVKGFKNHVDRRSQEIRDNKKKYKNLVKNLEG